jgi:hypothetical protein
VSPFEQVIPHTHNGIDSPKLPINNVTPAGSDGEVQYNNNGALGASSKFTWDEAGTTLVLGDDPSDGVGLFATPGADLDIFTQHRTSGDSSSGAVTVWAGHGFGSGNGGIVQIVGGDGGATGNGGTVTIASGTRGSTSGVPGDIEIFVDGGASADLSGGDVYIASGSASGTGDAGDVNIELPTASGTGRHGQFRVYTNNAFTGGAPNYSIRQKQITTTNATITTLDTISLLTNQIYLIEARVLARRTGGTAGTANDCASYIIVGTFKNSSGTVTQVGATTMVHSVEDQAAWDCVFTVSGTTVLVQVTGAANNNVAWHSSCVVQQVTI